MSEGSLDRRRRRGHQAPRSPRAFTLLELLVVISIIVILLAIALPAISKARDRARTVACGVRMKSFHTASILYSEDFRAIPSTRGDQPITGPTPPPWAPAWGFFKSKNRPWARGPGFITANMAGGYLPKLKDAAWCPSKDRDDANGVGFWTTPIDDKDWGLEYSPYAGNGQVFDSVDDIHYFNGGAIRLSEWDLYPKAYYVTETPGNHVIELGSDVEGAPNGRGRHQNNVLVLIADGHVVEMPSLTVISKINNDDAEFCWGR